MNIFLSLNELKYFSMEYCCKTFRDRLFEEKYFLDIAPITISRVQIKSIFSYSI